MSRPLGIPLGYGSSAIHRVRIRQPMDRGDARGLSGGKIAVQQTPNLASCLRLLEDAAGSVVAIEVAMFGVASTLRTIRDIRKRYPSSYIIALTDSENAHEALLREAGAVHVVASRREVRAAVRLVQRCLASSETRPASYRDEVWNRMPWRDCTAPALRVD